MLENPKDLYTKLIIYLLWLILPQLTCLFFFSALLYKEMQTYPFFN